MSDGNSLFERVLAEFAPALRRLVRAYEREPDRAEDLYQDVCLALWNALPGWRQDSSLRTFVFRIAHNRGATHGWREGRREASALPQEHDVPDPAPSAEAVVDQRQRRNSLLRAIRTLPLGLQQAVGLRLEGLSNGEIAEILGISPGAVRVRLHRSQKLLIKKVPTLWSSESQTVQSPGGQE